MFTRPIIVLLSLLSFCCKQKKVALDPDDNIRRDSSHIDTRLDSAVSTSIENLVEDVVPVNANSTELRILLTGTFHGNEVAGNVPDQDWLALYAEDAEHFVLRRTQIVAVRVPDAIMDDEQSGEMTGWEISTEDELYPTLLITGGNLKEGPIQSVQVPTILYPGDSVRLQSNGVDYLLHATGVAYFDSLYHNNYISNYRLIMVRTEKRESLQSILVTHADFDDSMTNIMWCGDLDRDGYLDFLIDMSRHYNQRLPTLFLSKPAHKQGVIPVAEHSSVGC